MSAVSNELLLEKDCTPKCHSRRHAESILSCVTKGSSAEIRSYCSWLCHNFTTITDELGRNVLHLASSCGKCEIVEWLLEHCHCDANVRDVESGWTALHRSFFYGQLTVSRILLNHGANIKTTDHDGLTPLDLIIEDRLPYVEYNASYPQDVYVWGSNVNFNLGLGNEQSRAYPEILEIFRRDNLSIKQVVMCKFHSVFLTSGGRLYTCGHGHGGRLGQGTEVTSLAPSPVQGLSSLKCQQVGAGQDHLILLMDGNQVWTCGLNVYHQLGHSPVPERLLLPKPISLKFLKGKEVVGVCAARFHSVLYTKDSVFTFGLNAGQLGHPKGERTQILPRQVSGVYNKDWLISHVVASDGATVCATNRGDVYVLHEFQNRKIASKQLGIRMLSVVGGHLDSSCDASGVREGGGLELRVLLLTQSGKLYLWRQTNPYLRRCIFTSCIQPVISDVHLNHYSFAMVTHNNQGYIGTILPFKEKKTVNSISSPTPAKSQTVIKQLNVFLDRDDCYIIRAKRLPYIHRATSITSDTKARDFSVLQACPKMGLLELPVVSESKIQNHFGRLLEEASLDDTFHDVVIMVGHKQYPAHKYVLAYRSEYFRKQLANLGEAKLIIENVLPEAFEQVLKFIYSNTCDFLAEGHMIKWVKDSENVNSNMISEGNGGCNKNVSKEKQAKNSKKKKKGNKVDCDPVKCVQEASKRFNIHSLTKALNDVRLVDGRIHISCTNQLPRLRFDQHKMTEYSDVILRSEDAVEFHCHKCVLAARSDYFHSMLGSFWLEKSHLESLSLPITSTVMIVLLNYLYHDADSHIYATEDPEFLCHVLVVADQLLMSHLKEMCEMALVNLLTLKNAPELLQLAFIYNAEQLKGACMEYICINLPAIFETKNLDVLSDEVMQELTITYHRMVPAMRRRIITPNSSLPTREFLQDLEKSFPVNKDSDMVNHKAYMMSAKSVESKSKGRRKLFQNNETKEICQDKRERCDSESSEKDICLNIVALDKSGKEVIKEDINVAEPVQKSADAKSSVLEKLTSKKPGQWIMSFPKMEKLMSLDKIMEEERKLTVLQKQISSNTESKESKHRLPHLSQKQKKLMTSAAAANPDSTSQLSVFPSLQSSNEGFRSPPICPWGKTEDQLETLPSFWDAMAKGELQSLPNTSSPLSPKSPIHTKSAEYPVLTVGEIQKAEEEEQHKSVIPKVKPLQLINLEDQAIEELLAMYKAVDNPRERITVSRVLPERIANPVWKKRAMSSLQM